MLCTPDNPRGERGGTVTEKQIETAVCEYARKKGCWVRKFSSPAHRGVPDRVFLTPHGRIFFIEFKRPGGKLSKLQEREIREIKSRGGYADVVWDITMGKALVDQHL